MCTDLARPGRVALAATAALILSPQTARAVDLTVQSIEVSQSVQYGATRLVGGNVTVIRVFVDTGESDDPVGDVDAVLRITVDGEDMTGSLIYSSNGPINAPVDATPEVLNHSINFIAVIPASDDVDLQVTLDPWNKTGDTNLDNNEATLENLSFVCRKDIELVYVPIDYTPVGGLPNEWLIEPGVGDGFVRAIYSVGEWVYHRSPTPPLVWTQNINETYADLALALHDMRINQLPAAGYPAPEFLYGWLKDNPFSGNGFAIGAPGDVAFGNTEPERHQRTFAHEMGHLFGLFHNSETIGTVGVDAEHHLQDTQDLGQVFPTHQLDVMVSGQTTEDAYVHLGTYDAALDDARTLCSTSAPAAPTGPVLRIAGVYDSETGAFQAQPAMLVPRGAPDQSQPGASLIVTGSDAIGAELFSIARHIAQTSQSCASTDDHAETLNDLPFHTLVPTEVNGSIVHRIVIRDARTGAMLADIERSPNAPAAAIDSIEAVHDELLNAPQALGAAHAARAPDNLDADETFEGEVTVNWSASDADGDALTFNLLYSPDNGDSWLPLALNMQHQTSFTFDSSRVPSSRGANGRLKLIASDGMNNTAAEWQSFALGGGEPPATYLITPNDLSTFQQHASIAFHGTSWDLEDQRLTGADIRWTSNIDGEFGAGELFTAADLSPGIHTITVTGEDADGDASSSSITIEVKARTIGGPDLNGDGEVGPADLAIILGNWNETSSIADLDGNGIVGPGDVAIVLGNWG